LIILLADTSRAQWAIDDVVIAFNDTAKPGFEEDFRGSLRPDVWYMVMNAVPRAACQSHDNALEFSKNGTPSTFTDYFIGILKFLQCFDTVGWAAGRASGL